MTRSIWLPWSTALAAVAIAAGCTSGNVGGKVVTVTVPPSTPPAATGSPAGNLSGSNTATPSATAPATLSSLPGDCAGVLSDYYVQQALGGATLAGRDDFIVGKPDTSIGRRAMINCRYGVVGNGDAARAKIEIGVSLYGTAAQASARITDTAATAATNGAKAKSVTVTAQGQPPATGRYLTGGTGGEFELPVLVVASGQRTVAVTVDPDDVTSPPAEQAATAIAKVALQRTAG